MRDEPVEIGPSGPAAATPLGVLFHDAEGALFLSPLGPLPRRASPASAPVTGLPEDVGRLPLGRGPGFSGSHAYWISQGSLVRRAVSAGGRIGPLEVLARDALDGTRVGVPLRAPGVKRPARPEVAAYIVRPEAEGGPLRARLWVEGAPAEPLTPEGNTAHSVSLVDARGGLLAISVQARMALTPIHARRIGFGAGSVTKGEDVVVWVGSGIHSLTELTLLPHGESDLFGFMPHERSTTEFGVARLDIGQAPDMETPTSWLLYPNGIDPAPVAAAHLCGAPVLFSAEPTSAVPGAAHSLRVRRIAPGAPGPAETLAEAPAIYFVSASTLPRGALVTWVTDQGLTMATTLRCPRRPG
ncbi:MAG: hypothetical protein FJ104_06140 [Deltaproteobacteria bacterium]|nr:hypothetical protein [Deltaproteobacteria bacterium]